MSVATLPDSVPHTHSEDALALCIGVLLISVGVAFYSSAGLLTGGTAGLAFLIHYATGITFGKAFFVLNLPFYWLALRKMGWAFTLKTFIAVALLSVLTELQRQFLQFASLQPLYAAIAGGIITGTGFLVLFRHRSSLGGVGILALDGGAAAGGVFDRRGGGAEPGTGHQPPARALHGAIKNVF